MTNEIQTYDIPQWWKENALKWQIQINRTVTKLSAWDIISILLFDRFIGSFSPKGIGSDELLTKYETAKQYLK